MDDEIIKDYKEELIKKEKEPFRHNKRTLIIFSLICAAFVISLVIVEYPVGDILQGISESTPLRTNVLHVNNFTITFLNSTLTQLQTIYHAEQEQEFSVCLLGNKINGDYYITSLYEPRTFSQSFSHITTEPCDEHALIMLHSHPYKSCIASDTDIATLTKTRTYNPDILMVIMCEPERFSVY